MFIDSMNECALTLSRGDGLITEIHILILYSNYQKKKERKKYNIFPVFITRRKVLFEDILIYRCK